MHLELLKNSKTPSAAPTQPILTTTPLALPYENEDPDFRPHLNDEPEPEPHAPEQAIEYHPFLTGTLYQLFHNLSVIEHFAAQPCDVNGNPLAAGVPPPLRTTAEFGDWTPFDNRVEFELAEFLFKREQMSNGNIDDLMDLWAASNLRDRPPFADHRDLYSVIDSIQLGQNPWACFSVRYSGPLPSTDIPSWMTQTYEVWYRDPRKTALNMLNNPDFDGEFNYQPYRKFHADGEREYSNLMSGNWAWKQAVRFSHSN